MPYFLAPGFALAGLLAAAGVVLAHLIAASRRAPAPLPTIRFVASSQQRSAALKRRPGDVVLLMLRAGALLLAGVALARPAFPVADRPAASLTIADFSGAASASEVWDSVLVTLGGEGLVIVSGDSVQTLRATEVAATRRLLAALTPRHPPRPVTAALIEALREATALSARGRPVRLSIVSALTQASLDSATTAVRALWHGPIRLIAVAPHRQRLSVPAIVFHGAADDPLRFAAAAARRQSGDTVLLLRGTPTAADSAHARAGGVVVHWPRTPQVRANGPAVRADTVNGVWVGDYTWVAPLLRRSVLPEVDSGTGRRVVARWIDGSAAAVDTEIGNGCIRDVAIGVPDIGDLPISRGLVRVLKRLAEPCADSTSLVPLSEAQRRQLAGSGQGVVRLQSSAAASSNALVSVGMVALAIVALLVELVFRRRRT